VTPASQYPTAGGDAGVFQTAECDGVVTAEDAYTGLVNAGRRLDPGATVTGVATVGGWTFPVRVDVRANRVWPNGRLFLVCTCGRRCTQLYLPAASHCMLACRRRLGLSYGSARGGTTRTPAHSWSASACHIAASPGFRRRGFGGSVRRRRVSGRPHTASFADHGRDIPAMVLTREPVAERFVSSVLPRLASRGWPTDGVESTRSSPTRVRR